MIEENLTVAFLSKTPNKVLTEADTCFKVLKMPEYHTPSMKILWNTWIFPFHTVKCGVWKDLDT